MVESISELWGLNGGLSGQISDVVTYVLWGILFLVVAGVIFKKYRDKKIFKYPVRILRKRQNGKTKEINTIGGYIVNKHKVTEFIIKTGKFKTKKMSFLPDADLMDEDDRVYYYQIDPETYIQTYKTLNFKKIFVPNKKFIPPTEEEKEILIKLSLEENKELSRDEAKEKVNKFIESSKGTYEEIGYLEYQPIRTDIRTSTINEIKAVTNTLGVDVNKQFAYFVAGVIALVALGAIVFYIATNKGHFPILESFLPLLTFRKLK